MPTGTLTYYDPERGFGFIGAKPNATFVHVSELNRAGIQCPDVGMKLAFDVTTSRDGRASASDVEWLDEAEAA